MKKCWKTVKEEHNIDRVNTQIDREYAIKQTELGIKEAKSEEERKFFKRVQEFLMALPSPEELQEHVYCTMCNHFTANEDGPECPCADLCYFWDTEDSVPRRKRWCYNPKA